MDLLSLVSNSSGRRTGGVAIASAVLAAPVLFVSQAGSGVFLFAAAVVAVAAAYEGRMRVAGRTRDVPRLTVVPPPAVFRPRSTGSQLRARWELVERDGQRSLSMRWE